ncbi:Mobile element protein [Richelia intracellularis]|nr:Mobile element protein [Richelia intracellularis]
MVSLTRRLAPTGFKSSKPKIKSSKNLSIANATALREKMSLVFSEIEDPPVERTRVYLLTDGVAESGDDFTKFSTISQCFQTLIIPHLCNA